MRSGVLKSTFDELFPLDQRQREDNYLYLYFADEKTDKLSSLPEVTQPVSGTAT